MDQIKDRIEYGSRVMEYAIEYRARKTLGICVHPDGRIEVKAPVEAPLEQIRSHVHRRASWIYRQQRYFDSLGIHTPERRYVSGESHLYLGRQYMLRVVDSERNEVQPSGIALKEMATRWGSCTASGQILLNPRLVGAPRICIEYVIVHELCHLVHHNHTKAFYELLAREMPDWPKWKMKLERLMI